MFLSKEAIKFYQENIKYFTDENYRKIANYLIEAADSDKPISSDSIITDIQTSDDPNAEALINIISTIEFSKNEKCSDKVLNDYYKVILTERSKIHDRRTLDLAMEGKSPQEQARIVGDYLAKHRAKSQK